MQKFQQLIQEEFGNIRWRWLLARLLVLPFPAYTGGRFRATVFRLIGFQVGHGTLICRMPIIIGTERFTIGKYGMISAHIFFDLAAPIIMGDHVVIGSRATLITGAHKIGEAFRRAGTLAPEPIYIEDGSWIGANCSIMPGVTIGKGAVVAAGSVVIKDVPPNTLVAGVPAVVKRELEVRESEDEKYFS